jgi:transcriptional regulator with XRE-family HTH domain
MPSSSPLEVVGHTVRKLRRGLKLSQEDLADETGLHHTFISLVERGKTNLSLRNLFRIARALNASPSDLLSGVTLDALRASAELPAAGEE